MASEELEIVASDAPGMKSSLQTYESFITLLRVAVPAIALIALLVILVISD